MLEEIKKCLSSLERGLTQESEAASWIFDKLGTLPALDPNLLAEIKEIPSLLPPNVHNLFLGIVRSVWEKQAFDFTITTVGGHGVKSNPAVARQICELFKDGLDKKLGTCKTCQRETMLYQITKNSTSPTCTTYEWWSCEPCVDAFYDSFVATFGSRQKKQEVKTHDASCKCCSDESDFPRCPICNHFTTLIYDTDTRTTGQQPHD